MKFMTSLRKIIIQIFKWLIILIAVIIFISGSKIQIDFNVDRAKKNIQRKSKILRRVNTGAKIIKTVKDVSDIIL